jgi:N-acetylglucosamine kinase-like BadF-type ATPase
VGRAALWHAVRADDGRGEPTLLQEAVAAHFEAPDATSVGIAIHLGRLSARRLGDLAPVVMATAARGDRIAGALVDRLASEIALLATVSMRRLGLLDRPVDLVLGGGVARSRDPRLFDRLTRHVLDANPRTGIVVVDVAPVVGAVLLGLDALGATPEVGERLRADLVG